MVSLKMEDEILAVNGGNSVRHTMLPYGKQTIDGADIREVVQCLQEPYLTTGPRVAKFEQEVCDYTGAKFGVAVSNGTTALHTAVKAAGIKVGDEVIVSDITFVASANAVLYEGGTVVFADVNMDTMNVDVSKIKSLITARTKAIIAVDMCGQPCDYDPLLQLCKDHGLILIEDAAHALGASYKGRKVGSFADLTCLSFHPVKNITTGEGGMVVTNDEGLYKRACMARCHGIDRDYKSRESQSTHRYDMVDLGYNHRLTDIQCALGSSQLKKLDSFIQRRNEIANAYATAFKDCPGVSTIRDIDGVVNAHHLAVIRLNLDKLKCDRDEFFAALKGEKIGVNVHYTPVHRMAYYQSDVFNGSYSSADICPNAVALYTEIISLPCFPLMTDQDIEDVIAAVIKVYNTYAISGLPKVPVVLGSRKDAPIKLITNFAKSDEYRAQIHKLIPGGAHTYSKGDDQFPIRSPAAIAKGEGAYVIDLDGNKYLDCSCGLSSVNLGHAYKPVINAVVEQLHLGTNFQRPASIERDIAVEFLKQVAPIGHDRIKFAKNGSTVTTAALKLARGYTKRKYVCRPSNHPFYSYDDWFIGTTPCDYGIPDEIKKLTLTFDSMKPETLEALVEKYPDQIAAVITEPDSIADACAYTKEEVAAAHLKCGEICRANGIVLIIDEMVSGYRSGFPGASVVYGHQADMCCWGKSIGNGYSFCALTGKAALMDLGGINEITDESGDVYPRLFLCSTTHGAETIGLAAALEVIKTYKENDVIGHAHRLVKYVHEGMKSAVKDAGLEGVVEQRSNTWVTISIFKDKNGQPDPALRTLFLQEMIARGVLFQGIVLPSFSHTTADMDYFMKAYKESLVIYRKAIDAGTTDGLLVGHVCKPVFRRFN